MKKLIWIPLVIIIAAAVLCFFHFRTEEPAEVERETLNDPDFLKDKEALLYFSTTADQDTFGGGKSYALFADKKGRLFSYQMKGLELGSAKVHDESVLLEDKKGIYTVQDGLHTYKRAYQHTGDSAGYIERIGGFYTLYNSGYDKSGGSYRSELYRQIDGKWKQDVIPHYIRASGFFKDHLFALTPTDDEKGYHIQDIQADKEKLHTNTIATWTYKEGTSVESQLAADDNAICFLTRGEKADHIYQMVKVMRNNGVIKTYDIASYKDDEQTLYDSMPFSFKNSFFMEQHSLYFVDGFGTVYRINPETGKSKKAFTLPASGMKADFKDLTHQNGKLYLFTYSYKKPAKIESFDLKTGKKLNGRTIPNLKNIVTPKSHLKLYDVQVIEEFYP
ncbi:MULTISPECIES: hypothetical protein [Bacillus amyloliquefaciens group]|uniref:hypothetical protein n=1 Tax=Bacillus amyloliquefaciens group TaxID=1938374 RepID=UPI000B5151F7|nr:MULTISPECIES: hypothetical protein [Bacillus amyloliquefaciens group]ASF30714.1 hypothetical protein WV34_18895 [Bacillus amyloliquefaciens]MDQ8093276.1 hypothetical protein [Bacillus amyloliquefaciens]